MDADYRGFMSGVNLRKVLDCGSPLPLLLRHHHCAKSARRLAHSRTLARFSLALKSFIRVIRVIRG